MGFHGDSLFSIISGYIFKYLFLGQWLSIFCISCQPKSWCLSIEIVSNTKIIFPNFNHLRNYINLRIFTTSSFSFLLFLCWFCQWIIIIIVTIINIKYFILSCWLFFWTWYDLHWFTIILIINVNDLLRLFIFGFWI